MDKNIQLLYCIVGSAVLALLNSYIFDDSRFSLFYAGTLVGRLIDILCNILSLVGIILLGIFSIILIIRNMPMKK